MNLLSLLFENPLVFVVFLAVFLLALSVHEYSHALMAFLLGDKTAQRMQRLTLNPLAHVDPLGFLTLVVAGFGWGKPVPFNPYNLRYRRWGPAMVAAAGPFSNFFFGTLLALAHRVFFSFLGEENLLIFFLAQGAFLNFLLMLFNLIPLAPLDGSKALIAALAHERFHSLRTMVEVHGPYILIFLIILDSLFQLHWFSLLSQGAIGLSHWIQTF